MNKFWKIFFFTFMGIFLLALGLQIYEYSGAETIKVVSLDYTWREAQQALGWYTLGLFVMNALVYKFPAFGTSRNQIANGFLACSVLALLYYSVSNMLLPLIYFAQLGRLDLFIP